MSQDTSLDAKLEAAETVEAAETAESTQSSESTASAVVGQSAPASPTAQTTTPAALSQSAQTAAPAASVGPSQSTTSAASTGSAQSAQSAESAESTASTGAGQSAPSSSAGQSQPSAQTPAAPSSTHHGEKFLGTHGRVLVLILEGMIIGIGGILPGVSGGVLCVIFGLYQPVIAVLSNPIANLRYQWRLVIPAGLGVGLGFLGCAGLVNAFMEQNSQAAVCVFIGLIVGMLPNLWKDAGREGRTPSSFVALGVSLLAFLCLLLFLRRGVALSITPNFGWFVVCGVAWGLSIVVPGLSSSSMLIFFGLYQPMLAGMARLDVRVLLPLLLGACAVVFSLSRAVNVFFARHYALASHCILGIVIATTVMILPVHFHNTAEILIDLACIAGGIVAAIVIDRLCSRIAAARTSVTH